MARAEAASQVSTQLMNKGITQLDSAKFADAIRLFEQAATANPKNAEAFTYLGRSYNQAGLNQRAHHFYDIALEIDPDEIKALSWSGQLDVMEEDVDKAGEKLVRLQRLCGATCPEYKNLKSALDSLGTEN